MAATPSSGVVPADQLRKDEDPSFVELDDKKAKKSTSTAEVDNKKAKKSTSTVEVEDKKAKTTSAENAKTSKVVAPTGKTEEEDDDDDEDEDTTGSSSKDVDDDDDEDEDDFADASLIEKQAGGSCNATEADCASKNADEATCQGTDQSSWTGCTFTAGPPATCADSCTASDEAGCRGNGCTWVAAPAGTCDSTLNTPDCTTLVADEATCVGTDPNWNGCTWDATGSLCADACTAVDEAGCRANGCTWNAAAAATTAAPVAATAAPVASTAAPATTVKSSNTMIIVGVIVGLLAIGGGIAGYMHMNKGGVSAPAAEEDWGEGYEQ
jgi:hypothetical protein